MPRIALSATVLLTLCMIILPWRALAGEEMMLREINALKTRLAEMDQLKIKVADLEKQINEQKCSMLEQAGTVREVRESLIKSFPAEGLIKYRPGEGVEIAPCGFKIQADATAVIQGTTNANQPGNSNKSQCGASWSADIFIEKAFDDWGLALMHLEPGQADGVESALSVYSNVDRDTNETDAAIPVTELWYQQYLFSGQVAITAGKVDPANFLDQNEYAFNETTQFLCRIFRNSPAIEWPDDNTLGGSMAILPSIFPYMVLNASYLNADNTYKEIFSKAFISTELTLMPARAFGYNEDKWSGNYRLYYWYNGLDHPKLTGQGDQPADVSKTMNMGIGLSFDQKFTDAFGLFARAGWQEPYVAIVSTSPNAAPVEGTWSCGLQMTGKYWNRQDDVLAVAVGQLFPSKQYKDAGNGGAAEGHFEVYYNMKLNDNFAITPDLQWIWNPRGIDQPYQGYNNTIFVYGVRTQVEF